MIVCSAPELLYTAKPIEPLPKSVIELTINELVSILPSAQPDVLNKQVYPSGIVGVLIGK